MSNSDQRKSSSVFSHNLKKTLKVWRVETSLIDLGKSDSELQQLSGAIDQLQRTLKKKKEEADNIMRKQAILEKSEKQY